MAAGEGHSYKLEGMKRKKGRKAMSKRDNFRRENSANNSGNRRDETVKTQRSSSHRKVSVPQTSFLRKQVDPETAKYFAEISNVIEGSEIDLEERLVICGNALDEARGKEVELATDYIISHTLETLLEGCSVEHLCGFLRSLAKDFSRIATDRSGSHVAETALKALLMHLEDIDTHSLIEETLSTICKMIVGNPLDMMCNCYGSHVLRSLLCLCRGVPLDSSEIHATKSSVLLAERLSVKMSQPKDNNLQHLQPRFPELLKFLVSGMVDTMQKDMATLQANQYSSLVLQAALKLLADQDELLLHVIPIILGCSTEKDIEGNFTEMVVEQKLLSLMEETGFSHLMEVILEVAPETLYNELFFKLFRNLLFDLSSDQYGNFVVQALVSHARTQDQMEIVWDELGSKFKDLLEMGRSGVVASVVAACQRLHSNENKCCQAVAAAVCGVNESTTFVISRILFLDNYFSSDDKSSWNWPNAVKMHVVGSLILQSIFRFPTEFIQTYVISIISLGESHILQTTKDPSGSRVIEAFLASDASAKQKRRLVLKLRGHFGEISLHPSGSFTIEKCFNACNLSLREMIVSELLPVQTELSKTRQGPYLLKKLDVDGFATRPDQWKLRQTSKQTAYEEFYAAFGPSESKASKRKSFLAEPYHKSKPEKLKEMRKEIDSCLSRATPTSGSHFLSHQASKNKLSRKGTQGARSGDSMKSKKQKTHNRK